MDNYRFIVLGSDQNAYGQVRAIHEITHKKVDVIAQSQLSAIKYSKIINLKIFPDLLDDQKFVKHLIDIYHEFNGEKVMLFPFPCGDTYVGLLSRNSKILKKYFTFPFNDYRLTDKLTDKQNFISIADQNNLPHPNSIIITPDDYKSFDYSKIGNNFPVALKAVDSVRWLDINFSGRKKAYVLNSSSELHDIVAAAYDAGYDRNFIVQDFIPGGASSDRVLNCYVDRNHHVKMMSLGHPILEDPGAAAIGNYLTILPAYDSKLYEITKNFLEAINYTGFANFDLKLDPRDNQYKFLEINLRFGRSSYYVNLNGVSFPQLLIDDYFSNVLKDKPIQYCNEDSSEYVLWNSVPLDVLKTYAHHDLYYLKASDLIKKGAVADTLSYPKDMSLKRKFMIWHMKSYYRRNFKKNLNQISTEKNNGNSSLFKTP